MTIYHFNVRYKCITGIGISYYLNFKWLNNVSFLLLPYTIIINSNN